jgi:hypothetical protein
MVYLVFAALFVVNCGWIDFSFMEPSFERNELDWLVNKKKIINKIPVSPSSSIPFHQQINRKFSLVGERLPSI